MHFVVCFSLKHQSVLRSSLEQFECSGSCLNTRSVPVFRGSAGISDNYTEIDDCNERDKKTWSYGKKLKKVHGNILKINLLNILRYSHITIMRDLYKPALLFLQLFLEKVLMWLLLQVCLHHEVISPYCWGVHVFCACVCPWIRPGSSGKG